jgi:cytochrome c biogenesis protein CcdA
MSLSFIRGMVAAVNPCGFVLLPTYLMFFLGLEGSRPGTQRASVRRALLVSAALSAGFMAVFVTVGLISYNFTNWIQANAKYATVVIGLALVALGISMLLGFKLAIATPQIGGDRRDGSVRSMFVYGIAYAVASLGCTIGLFLPTLIAVRRGFADAVGNVAAYGFGMALLVTALTVSLAIANQGLLLVLRRSMQHVNSIAAIFIVLSGVYLVYYFWVVDINGDVDPITTRVERFQTRVTTLLNDHRGTSALVLTTIVAAAIVYVVARRDRPVRAGGQPTLGDTGDADDAGDAGDAVGAQR